MDTLPAVDKHGSHVGRLGGGGPADEGEDGQRVLGDAHVRPLGVMILEHRPLAQGPRLRVPLPTLDGREGGKEGREEMFVRWEGKQRQHILVRLTNLY